MADELTGREPMPVRARRKTGERLARLKVLEVENEKLRAAVTALREYVAAVPMFTYTIEEWRKRARYYRQVRGGNPYLHEHADLLDAVADALEALDA